MLKKISKFKESEVYQIYKEREKLIEEENLLTKQLEKKRMERIYEINLLKKELEEKGVQIRKKIEEIEKIHEKQRYELCCKVGHSFDTENNILSYNGDHSSRYGMGCEIEYKAVCKFCGHETSGVYSSYHKCVKFHTSDELSEEQIKMEDCQKKQLEKLFNELENLRKNDLKLQFELEKMCKLLGHMVPPFNPCICGESKICKCCGKVIEYHD